MNLKQNKSNIFSEIISIAILVSLCLIGFVYLVFAFSMTTIPASTVLNKNDASLTPGDIWTVNNQFSIWIDSIEEVRSDIVQERYPEIQNTPDKRYFDVTFSFYNISFSGCKYDKTETHDYLEVQTTVIALDKELNQAIPSTIKEYSQDSYNSTLINGVETPIKSGILSENNHLFFEIDSSKENIDFLAIRFIVPIEILSAEASVQYRRDYLFSVPNTI